MKRYKLTNKKRFLLILTIVSMVLYFTGMIVSAGAASQDIDHHEIVKITKGDTLWEIASTYCPSGDIRAYLFEIKQLNHLASDTIHEGQVIILP